MKTILQRTGTISEVRTGEGLIEFTIESLTIPTYLKARVEVGLNHVDKSFDLFKPMRVTVTVEQD